MEVGYLFQCPRRDLYRADEHPRPVGSGPRHRRQHLHVEEPVNAPHVADDGARQCGHERGRSAGGRRLLNQWAVCLAALLRKPIQVNPEGEDFHLLAAARTALGQLRALREDEVAHLDD